MFRGFAVLLLTFSSLAQAQGNPAHSAHRAPGASYLGYKASAKLFSLDGLSDAERVTPLNSAKTLDLATLPKATEWDSEDVMTSRFAQFRDYRFMTVPKMANFLRRSSWMYPDDGCFARAALAVRNLSVWSFNAPKKVFAFGDLNVKSNNAMGGEVSWWYHVAPLVEVNGQKYVLDPALQPSAPLKLQDWLARMSDHPESLEVSVCESGTYAPGDDCAKSTDGIELGAERDQIYYLEQEWERLVDLQRNPEQELGEHPPWLN